MAFLQVFAFADHHNAQEEITTLTVGVSVNDSISQGDYKIYQVTGASDIKLYNLSGDIDLYVATENGESCYPAESGTTDEACKVNPSDAVFIEVYGYESGTFSLLAEGKTPTKTDENNTLFSEDASLSKGDWKYYKVSGAKTVKLFNLTSDLDLYVKSGSNPSFKNYDCRPYASDTTDETCDKINPSDTVHIGVYGYMAGNFSLLVTGDDDNNITLPPITEKDYVLIVKNAQPDVCESSSFKDFVLKKGFINPIFKEETNSITCATYDKRNDDNECTIVYAENKSDVACVIGYDGYQSNTRTSRSLDNNKMSNSIETIIYEMGL
jgi:hypothetical protein